MNNYNELNNYNEVLERIRLLQATGTLSVTSSPTNAAIYIDDNFSGYFTPANLQIPEGFHIIRLSLPNYLDTFTIISIAPEKTTTINQNMTSAITATILNILFISTLFTAISYGTNKLLTKIFH